MNTQYGYGTVNSRPMTYDGISYSTEKWEYLYLRALGVYIACALLDYTDLPDTSAGPLLSLIRYLCYGAALLKILTSDLTKSEIWRSGLLLLSASMVALQSDNKKVLFFTLMIVAAQNISMEKLMRVALISQGITLCLTVVASQIGLTSNYLFDITTRTRHGLGFNWTTVAPITYFFWMLLYIGFRKNRFGFLEAIILEGINYWFYQQTNARMVFYLATLMLMTAVALRIIFLVKDQYRITLPWKGTVFVFVPIACAVFALVIHILYSPYNRLLKKLNDVLTGRLRLGREGYELHGIKLLGQPIKWIGNGIGEVGKYNYVDCSYMQILLEFGVLVLVLIIAAYTLILMKAIRAGDWYLMMAICYIMVFNITEPRLFHLAFNPFLILTFGLLVPGNAAQKKVRQYPDHILPDHIQ